MRNILRVNWSNTPQKDRTNVDWVCGLKPKGAVCFVRVEVFVLRRIDQAGWVALMINAGELQRENERSTGQ